MDWQQIASLVVVAGAALFVIRTIVSGRRRKSVGCGPSCRCEPAGDGGHQERYTE